MSKIEAVDRRDPNDVNRIWQALGEHGAEIKTLKDDRYSLRQDFVNHQARTDGGLAQLEAKIVEMFKPLVRDVGHIKIFMYIAIGGGGALFGLLQNLDKIQHFIRILK